MKICSKCGLEKDPIEFYQRRASRDGLAFKCKTCCKAFEQTPHGKTIRNRAVRRYQATDRGKIVLAKVEKNRTGTLVRKASRNKASARYRKTEHGRIVRKTHDHRRRERSFGLDFVLQREDIATIYNRFEHKCFICKTPEHLSIDHHRPLSSGYGLSLQNAVLLCVKCNCTKGIKQPEDFYNQNQLEALRGLGII